MYCVYLVLIENLGYFSVRLVICCVSLSYYCGVDGLAAEHFFYADECIHFILSILFNCFISHGYLPEFMKTAIVLIIKNKTGDTSDKTIVVQ